MTDARPHPTPPRLNLSAREWKLFVIGGLGVAYAASLSVVATHPRAPAPVLVGSPPTTTTSSTTLASAARVPRIVTRTS